MTRREAREQAFLLIFEKSFREESMEEIIEAAVEARAIREDAFSTAVACGVCEKEKSWTPSLKKTLSIGRKNESLGWLSLFCVWRCMR